MNTLFSWATIAYTWIIELLPMLIKCAIILVAGLIGIKLVLTIVEKALKKSKADPTTYKFLLSVIRIALWFVVGIMALSAIGINTTSIIAAFSAAALAIGLAVKDNLANFASGVLMIFLRPFKVGDFVEIQGESGVVDEISILNTKLKTVDNKVILIPNSAIAGGNITNFSAEEKRRLDLTFSISYGDDFEKAKAIINDIVKAHPLTLNDPCEPFVRVGDLASSSVDIFVRVWVKNENYWDLCFDLKEKIKAQFDANGITIPFNQLDVNVNK